MDIGRLHDRVRQELLRRISKGTMSVSLLARQTGLGQPHISNFLRGKRRLSLSALDLVLDAQRLRVEDLLPRPREVDPGEDGRTETVPVVSYSVAAHDAYIRWSSILWQLTVARELLGNVEPRCSSFRRSWDRYVGVQVGVEETRGMSPVVKAGAVVVLDRQYLSFAAVREGEANLYGVRRGAQMLIRYGKGIAGLALLLSSEASLEPEVVEVKQEDALEEMLVGRVVLVVNRG